MCACNESFRPWNSHIYKKGDTPFVAFLSDFLQHNPFLSHYSGKFFAAFFPPMVAQPAQRVCHHAGKGSAGGGVTAVVADAWPGPQ
jgi:hypothetical protein